jgi:hypothetical protein
MKMAKMDQIAPGACHPFALALTDSPRNSKLTLYQGKNPTMNRSAPAMMMIFSPTLRALNLSINLSIGTS